MWEQATVSRCPNEQARVRRGYRALRGQAPSLHGVPADPYPVGTHDGEKGHAMASSSSCASGRLAIAGEIFGDSLLEQSFKRRLRWPAVLAECLEAIVVALILLAPILSSQGLPQLGASHTVVPMGAVSRPAAVPNSAPVRGPAMPVTPNALFFSLHPVEAVRAQPIGAGNPDPAPPCTGPNCVVGANSFGDPNSSMPPTLFTATTPVRPLAPLSRPHAPVRISQMNLGQLTHRVDPVYPPLAIPSRIQGPVVLAAVIARDGTIENLRVLSGNPMLVGAAVEAVRQWRYRPYVLDGEPVEVETQITVNFVLGK